MVEQGVVVCISSTQLQEDKSTIVLVGGWWGGALRNFLALT